METQNGRQRRVLGKTLVLGVVKIYTDNRYRLILWGTILLGFLIRLYNIQEPFIGLHDWASADVSRPPQAWLKYGLLNTKLAPVWNYGIVLDRYEYYLHWPSLTYVFILISYLVFGIHDWAARLVPVFFNTLTIVFVYLIGKEIWNRTLGYGEHLYSVLFLSTHITAE